MEKKQQEISSCSSLLLFEVHLSRSSQLIRAEIGGADLEAAGAGSMVPLFRRCSGQRNTEASGSGAEMR